MRNACSEEDIQALANCMESFFLKRPVLQSTASATDGAPARTMKSASEISAMWTEILTRRRLEEPGDTAPIADHDRLKAMHANWLREFIDHKLSAAQQLRRRSKQTSAFGAYLKNNFGGRALVMALWQTGITWAPTTHMQKNKLRWCFRAHRKKTSESGRNA